MARGTMRCGLLVAAWLLVVPVAGAQPGVDLRMTPAPQAQPPAQERLLPESRESPALAPPVGRDPMFIGPTITSDGTELGFSAWIAPNDPVGGRVRDGADVNGWAALGLTFTWGGPPHRPSSGRAIR